MATSIGVKLKMDGESEFRKGLQNIVSETKSLDKQLGALESSFDGEKKSLEENQKQTDLLEKKKAALEKQIEETSKALEYAKNNYEEGSKEISSWEGALADAEKELNQTNAKIEENADYLEQSTSAYGQLTAEIESQTTELESLRDAYIDAVLEYGEGSDEVQNLAGQISTLSSELETNQTKLEGARASLNNVTGSAEEATSATGEMNSTASELGGAFSEAASLVDSSFGNMVNSIATSNVAGLVMEIAGKVMDLIDEVYNLQIEFDESLSNIVVATGATGEALDDMKQKAIDAWAAVADKDASEEDYANIVGMLNTRLGATGDDLARLTELFGVYSATLGIDGTDAVNDLVDVMQKWNLTSEDNAQNYNTLNALAAEMVVAQQLADVSVGEVSDALINQSGTFQELGFSIEDSIGFMTAYRDAGGNVGDITRAMDQTINHLSGVTDDLGGAWNEMINIMVNSDSKMTALSTTVGDTGKTLSDVFGSKLAGRIYDTFNSAGVDMDTFAQKVDEGGHSAYNALWRTFNDSRTEMDNFSKWFRQTFSVKFLSDWTTLNDSTKTEIDESLTDVMVAGREMIGGLGTALGSAGDEITDQLKETRREAQKQKQNIISDLSTPIPMHISAPSIGYSQTGTGGNTRITPYYGGRYTFAKAYEQAMILTAPTVFGASGNNLLVGGDRPGNEIIVGEQHLLEMIGKASGGNNIVVNVYGAEGQDVSALADIVADRIQMRIERTAAVYA